MSKKKKKKKARPPMNSHGKDNSQQTSNNHLKVTPSLISLPEEIQDQIIQNIPVQDLPKIMLLSKAFYRQARPHFYKSIHYFDVSVARRRHITSAGVPVQHSFALMPSNARAWNPASSARIIRLAQFLRTITETQLSSHINEASFSTAFIDPGDGTAAEFKIAWAAEQECLNIFSQITPKLVMANSITSLDIVHTDGTPGQSARDHMYSIFSITSLRHLCLRGVRNWRCFSAIPDDTRIRTSNIISLSLLNTVPLDTDLQEILKWPKGLRCYNHESDTNNNEWFSYEFQHTSLASPQCLLQGIASQRETLLELSYNNIEDSDGNDGTIFDTELLCQFTKLTHMNVARECLIAHDYDTGLKFLNNILTPNLLELKLFEDEDIPWQPTDGDSHITAYIKRMGGWLQEIAHHRNITLPPLKIIVTWQVTYDHYLAQSRAEAQMALERFKGTDIQMEVFFKGFNTDQ